MTRIQSLAIALIAALFTVAVGTAERKTLPHLVTAEWLDQHKSDPNLVILQIGWNNHPYKNGHIPGARFIWTESYAPSTPDENTTLPTADELKKQLEDLGVNDNSEIVLYGVGNQMTMVTRLFLTFDYLGLADHVHILDGGQSAWTEAGNTLTTDAPAPLHGSITPHTNSGVVTDGDWVFAHYKDAGLHIVDARGEMFYNGGGGMDKPGHIPGAVNIPFSSLADTTNRYKDVDTLAAIFTKAGLKKGDRVVAYCHVGQQATMVYFVGKCLGYNMSLYDGSYDDWSVRKDAPAEVPPKKADKK